MQEQLLTSPFKRDFSKYDFILDPSTLAVGATNLSDSSGNSVPITNPQAVAVVDVGPNPGVKSLYFPTGSLKYLTIAAAKMPNILSGNFTVEYWYRAETRAAFEAILAQWAQVVGKGGFIIGDTNVPSVDFNFGAFNENAYLLRGTHTVPVGTWAHFAITRNGPKFTWWVNGTMVGTTTSETTRPKSDVNWSIGAYQNASGGYPQASATRLNGWLTQLKVSTFCRYNANFTPPIT